MRKNWLSVPVAAAVAAPFLIVLNAHVALAQNGSPTVTPIEEAGASAMEVTATTTTTTTGTQEVGAPLGTDGPTDLDTADELLVAPPFDADEDLLPLSAMGDDALPSLQQARNNPYLRASTAGLETGRTATGQEFGAFLPPTVTETEDVTSSQDTELVGVLGEEVYNRRVNISTPADTEVEEVIRILAERADLNFVYGEGVIEGKITLNLRDVPLGVALQSLLSTQDLAIVREGENVMRIARRADVKPGVTADMRTVYIKLNWVQSESIAKTLSAAVSGSGGKIQPHAETNTLIITDTSPNVAILRDLIAQLDVPEKQVMIEARMVELVLEANRNLASSVNLSRQGRLTAEASDNLDLGFIPGIGGDIDFGGVASILGSNINIDLTLSGLEERRVVNILANPRIITVNNEPATIDIIRDVPYIEYQQGAAEGFLRGTVQFEEAGVKLNVTPTITNNGYVRMNLKPEQMIVAGFVTVPIASGINNDIPIIDTRSAETNVIVKDEDTVVLGGLRQIDAQNSKSEYPWLARSPVLGWFFKSDNKVHTKNDLMLFVTPHIIKAPMLTPAENYKYTRIDAHWDLPDFFFDDSVDQREARHRFEADMDPRNYYPHDLLLPTPVEVDGAVDSSAAAGYGADAAVVK